MRVLMGMYREWGRERKWKGYANQGLILEFSLCHVPAVLTMASLTICPNHLSQLRVWEGKSLDNYLKIY